MLRRLAPVTALALALAPPSALADYDAGQQAWDAGQPATALEHWRSAAGAGDERAMLALGRLYVQGLGAPQDFVEAHMWLNLAASRGNAEAAGERNALSARMTPQQVATAQERASKWRPGASPDSVAAAPTDGDAGPPPVEALREAQALLSALGYAPGPADGIWGGRSLQAYRAFLRDAGLPPLNNLTPETLQAMRDLIERPDSGPSWRARADAPSGTSDRATPPLPPGPLRLAAQTGDLDRLASLLAAGTDVNARDGQGWTALMHAANKGHTLLVTPLVEAGADVDLRAADGATALFIAALHGHSEIIEQLMAADADIAIPGPKGRTAADVAKARYGTMHSARGNGESRAVLALLQEWAWSESIRCTLVDDEGGCWMETTNRTGCFVWNSNPQPEETVTWSGNCVDGRATGRGTLTWRYQGEDGVPRSYTAKGALRRGFTHGLWSWRDSDGDSAEGSRMWGVSHGHWSWHFSDGELKKGPFVWGRRQGHWREQTTDGELWEGPVIDGRKDGLWVQRNGIRGRYCWRDGTRLSRLNCRESSSKRAPIAVAEAAVMRFGPGNAYTEVGVLREGQLGVTTARTESGWLWIALDDGQQGYVPESTVRVFASE
ncbi:MAG: hypothetical protein F4Y02_15415 [Chloroflexi bacterium]|nr:hypothetical protein [Chloroflexota bacterium]